MERFFTCFFLMVSVCLAAQENVFIIDSSQSMIMTGKGPGQDGAINPYLGLESIAIIENLGKNDFSVRIQENGTVKEEVLVKAKERKEIPLGKSDELYIDTDKKAKTRLNFKPKAIMQNTSDELAYDILAIIQRYCAYNLWADRQLVGWLSGASEEELNLKIESSFSTLKETVTHIWGAEYLWLQVVKDESYDDNPAKTFEGNKEELCEGWLLASENFSNHVKTMTLEDLLTKRPKSSGEGYTVIADMIHHCMNHSTYHRGQLITMGRQAGLKDPPRTDFIYYVGLSAK